MMRGLSVGLVKVASAARFMTAQVSMLRFRNSLPFVAAVLVGAATLGAPTPARASYSVMVFDDGILQGGISTFIIGNSLLFTGSTTHFSITNGSGLSNNPGTPGSSNLDLASNEQVNATFGAAGGTHTIRIELSQTGWLAPTGTPLILTSSVGGSFADVEGATPSATQSVSSTYQGFLDNTNTPFGQPGSGSTPIQTASASRTSAGTSALVYSPLSSVNPLVPGGTPFSMTDVLTFTFTLGAGSGQATANASASSVATPVPEPATMFLGGLGLIVLGYVARRRLFGR